MILIAQFSLSNGQQDSPAYKYYQRCENTLNDIETAISKKQPKSQYESYFTRVENYLKAGKSKDPDFDFSGIESRAQSLKAGKVSEGLGELDVALKKVTQYRSWLTNLKNRSNIAKILSTNLKRNEVEDIVSYFKDRGNGDDKEIYKMKEGLRKALVIEGVITNLDQALQDQGVIDQLEAYKTRVERSTNEAEIKEYTQLGLDIVRAVERIGNSNKMSAYRAIFESEQRGASSSIKKRKKK